MTRKRHRAWANTKAIGALDRGCLKRHVMKSCKVKTTTKKVVDGKIKFSGNKNLKGTQLGAQFDSLRYSMCTG